MAATTKVVGISPCRMLSWNSRAPLDNTGADFESQSPSQQKFVANSRWARLGRATAFHKVFRRTFPLCVSLGSGGKGQFPRRGGPRRSSEGRRRRDVAASTANIESERSGKICCRGKKKTGQHRDPSRYGHVSVWGTGPPLLLRVFPVRDAGSPIGVIYSSSSSCRRGDSGRS